MGAAKRGPQRIMTDGKGRVLRISLNVTIATPLTGKLEYNDNTEK
jgi:hypothetical protein